MRVNARAAGLLCSKFGSGCLRMSASPLFMRKDRVPCITAAGDEPAVRLVVSRDLVPHVYPEG